MIPRVVEDPLSMLQSPERKTPLGADALEKLRQAASTYPGTPSIIRHAPKEHDSELDKVHLPSSILPSVASIPHHWRYRLGYILEYMHRQKLKLSIHQARLSLSVRCECLELISTYWLA